MVKLLNYFDEHFVTMRDHVMAESVLICYLSLSICPSVNICHYLMSDDNRQVYAKVPEK